MVKIIGTTNEDDVAVVQIKYYELKSVKKNDLLQYIRSSSSSAADLVFVRDGVGFLQSIFSNTRICDFLIYLSRQPVFATEFAEALKHDLELLAAAKRLKYFTNLTLYENVLLLNNVWQQINGNPALQNRVDALFRDKVVEEVLKFRFKDYIKTQIFDDAERYIENDIALEKIDPHAVYPTSIYRQCNGCTMATPDSRAIEAVMSTSISTTIKITRDILDPSNNATLAHVYKPLGRCVSIIGDKVEKLYGQLLDQYFDKYEIPLVKVVVGGNEVNKDIENVKSILLEMKQHGVARNEPVLIVGGGVVTDIGGLATALYNRNTPYVMLCTSIVSGIDAGPSPRTCCDGDQYKNLYGAYHPPVLTLTDRFFWKTLQPGWIRHGIAEIIKMACVKDYRLFQLLEQAGPKLIRTKFGTIDCDENDKAFQDLCDEIVGRALESYVRSEYGNLWETHQCRPHAFGHTWSPGYELPGGLLHGHAVATGMGYGAYLSYKKHWIAKDILDRILQLISDMELALWHPIMEDHKLVIAANIKMVQKRGGNLCAPVPKADIGSCGYINDMCADDIPPTMTEYKAYVSSMPRSGHGVDVHCRDVGLGDPSTAPGTAWITTNGHTKATTYMEWINAQQIKRNSEWEKNVLPVLAPDTPKPPQFGGFTLFHDGAEAYALSYTTTASKNIQHAASVTEETDMFMPCMVGAMESQFLKMQCQILGAKRCLDIGTFTGMSAIALAEGMNDDGKVITLEFDASIAKVARTIFEGTNVGHKIQLKVGSAAEEMKDMVRRGEEQFDLIFIDADKEKYIEYYELAVQLLSPKGIILADNSLCALLYDQGADERATKLHEFNEHVKNDGRTEQVVLTVREGITLIKHKSVEVSSRCTTVQNEGR